VGGGWLMVDAGKCVN